MTLLGRARQQSHEEEESAVGTAHFAKAKAAFMHSFSTLTQAAVDKAIQALDAKGENKDYLTTVLEPVFESLSRGTITAVEELSDSDIDNFRKGLKAQSSSLKYKMDALRTASSMQMKTQAAAMEASFTTTLKAKEETAKGAAGVELKEAKEKICDLEDELRSTVRNLERVEDMNKALKSVVRSKEIEAEHAKVQQHRMSGELEKLRTAVPSLKMWLEEALSEAENLKTLVVADAVQDEVERMATVLKEKVTSAQRGEFEDAQEQNSRLLADLTKVDARRLKAEAQAKEARREAEELREVIANSEAGALANAKIEIEALNTKQQKTSELLSEKQDELDALRRETKEKFNRTYNEAERAAIQSAEECKRQVEAMAKRLRIELQIVREEERESSQKQLARLLDELAEASRTMATMENKLNTALEEARKSQMLMKRLTALEDQEREGRMLIIQADARPGSVPSSPTSPDRPGRLSPTPTLPPKKPEEMQFGELLAKLLAQYRAMKAEASFMRSQLDNELASFSLSAGEAAPLHSVLTQVLHQHSQLRDDAATMRFTLDRAIMDVAITVGENANLSDKLRTLLGEYRRIAASERSLRKSLQGKQGSLLHALARVKEIEQELRNAHGVHAEQREALTLAALHALSSLRMRLGSVHAVRPEALKPVDEAIRVKRMTISHSTGALQMAGRAHTNSPTSPTFEDAATPARMTFTDHAPETGGFFSPKSALGGSPTRMLPPVSSPNWSPERSRRAGEGGRLQLMIDKPKGVRVPQPTGVRSDDDLLGPMMKQIVSL